MASGDKRKPKIPLPPGKRGHSASSADAEKVDREKSEPVLENVVVPPLPRAAGDQRGALPIPPGSSKPQAMATVAESAAVEELPALVAKQLQLSREIVVLRLECESLQERRDELKREGERFTSILAGKQLEQQRVIEETTQLRAALEDLERRSTGLAKLATDAENAAAAMKATVAHDVATLRQEAASEALNIQQTTQQEADAWRLKAEEQAAALLAERSFQAELMQRESAERLAITEAAREAALDAKRQTEEEARSKATEIIQQAEQSARAMLDAAREKLEAAERSAAELEHGANARGEALLSERKDAAARLNLAASSESITIVQAAQAEQERVKAEAEAAVAAVHAAAERDALARSTDVEQRCARALQAAELQAAEVLHAARMAAEARVAAAEAELAALTPALAQARGELAAFLQEAFTMRQAAGTDAENIRLKATSEASAMVSTAGEKLRKQFEDARQAGLAEADRHLQARLAESTAESERLLAEAQLSAKKIVDEAVKRATSTEMRALGIERAAEDRASQLVDAAWREAEARQRQADEYVAGRTKEVDEHVEKRRSEIDGFAQRRRGDAQRVFKELEDLADERARQIVSDARQEATRLLESAENKIKARNQTLKEQFARMKAEQESREEQILIRARQMMTGKLRGVVEGGIQTYLNSDRDISILWKLPDVVAAAVKRILEGK